MDAMAVSICKGLASGGSRLKNALILGFFFGAFQGIMPIIGYFMGAQFQEIISGVDHWIAFILLAFIGQRMVWGSIKSKADTCEVRTKLTLPDIIVLSIATSIDALAVGVSFAFLEVRIFPTAGLIAIVTFTLSALGVYLGRFCGTNLGSRAELAGGIVLILIGLKILLEGLGFL